MTADVELLPLPWIERYSVVGDIAYPVSSDPDGDYVAHDDHTDAMQAYARANLAPLQTEIKRLRAEVERLNRLLGRIVEGDGDSTLVIRAGTDAFAAAREYLSAPKPTEQENKA